MGPPTRKEEREGAKIMGIEAEEPSASARQGRARAYIEAGRDAIGRGGVGLEEAGNNFRKAAELMLSARVEAAGFTADDVWRWRGAKAGRVPLLAKDPSFSDYEVFARDNSLITEREYSWYEDVRRVGNASSHAGRRGLSEGPSEEDLRAACRSAEELLAGMAQGGPGAAAGDARRAVYLDILGSALEAKYRLQGFVDRNRSKAAGAPEDGQGALRARMEADERDLEAATALAAEYLGRLQGEWPDETAEALRPTVLAALEERVGRFERKVGFVSRRERQVKGKKDFIVRQAGNICRIPEVAAARRELEGLRADAAAAREELAGMVERLGDDFADAGRMVGEDATLPLRGRAAACAAESGFRRATFGTDKAKPAPGAARGRGKGDGPIREALRSIWDEMSVEERDNLRICLGLAAMVIVGSLFPNLIVGILGLILFFQLRRV